MSVTFRVYGQPVAKGNMRAFVNKKTGRAIVTEGKASATKPWQQEIAGAAAARFEHPSAGPVEVTLLFIMPRLKGHLRRDGSLRPGAPHYHTVKPDADKLSRTVLDALTGIAYNDDSQVASLQVQKIYGSSPGVTVWVRPLEGREHGTPQG